VPRVQAEADRGEDPGAVASDGPGELDERLELRARRPGQPRVEVFGGEAGGDLVEEPELVVEQEGAVEAPVVVLDFGEPSELVNRLGAQAP